MESFSPLMNNARFKVWLTGDLWITKFGNIPRKWLFSPLGFCNCSCALPSETNCVVAINISFKNICISITERLIPAWKPTTPLLWFWFTFEKKNCRKQVRTGKIYPFSSAKRFPNLGEGVDSRFPRCDVSKFSMRSCNWLGGGLPTEVSKFSMKSSNLLGGGGGSMWAQIWSSQTILDFYPTPHPPIPRYMYARWAQI